MLRHLLVTLLKINKQSLKITNKNDELHAKEQWLKADFWWKTVQARWNIFKYWNKKCQYKILYSTKIDFKDEDKIKWFFKKRKQKEFMTSISVLKEISMKILQSEGKKYQMKSNILKKRIKNIIDWKCKGTCKKLLFWLFPPFNL